MNAKDKAWRDHIGPEPGTRHRRHCFDAGYEAGIEAGKDIQRRLARVLNNSLDANMLQAKHIGKLETASD